MLTPHVLYLCALSVSLGLVTIGLAGALVIVVLGSIELACTWIAEWRDRR